MASWFRGPIFVAFTADQIPDGVVFGKIAGQKPATPACAKLSRWKKMKAIS
jgi:hypothetical protein